MVLHCIQINVHPLYLTIPVSSDGFFRILYEEVDESEVGIVKFPSFSGEASGVEEYRYKLTNSIWMN